MLKNILYGFLALIALVVIVSFLLPGKVHVERKAEISAPASKIFTLVNNFKSWEKWSPWFEMDPSMDITWGDKTTGAGASYCWKGDPDKSGSGCMEITESVRNTSLNTKIDFGDQGIAEGGWTFEENEGITQVTWGFDADVSSPPVIGKYFGLMMDGFVGPDFEKGLAKMKDYVESLPPYSIEISDASLGPIHFIYIRNVTTLDNLGAQMGESAGIMAAYMNKNKLEMGGNVFAEYFDFSETVDYAFCFPIKSNVEIKHDQIQYGYLEKGNYKMGIHSGPYDAMEPTYNEMDRFMAENGLERIKGPIEIYITDPSTEPDPGKWITHIYFPIGS